MWVKSLTKRATTQPAPISVAPNHNFTGNDGPWSTFPIQVGTPPQTVNVLISTSSAYTLVVDPKGCADRDPSDCPDSRGGLFDNSTSSTWNTNQNAFRGIYPITSLNMTSPAAFGYDTVALAPQGSSGPTLDQQLVARVAEKDFYLGSFGLNPHASPLPSTTTPLPDFMTSLNQSDMIPSLSWSYTAGNQYRSGPPYGSLTLGGYDSSRFVPNHFTFPFNGTDARSLIVNIGQMILITDDFYTISETPNQSLSAAIDSSTPYIVLPLNVCQQFEEAFGITWDGNVQAYLVNDTLHETLLSHDTSVIFNLVSSSTIPGEGFNISLPYSAFDLTASAPLLTNSSRYFPLMRAANNSQITLGRTFLQEAYLIADYERNNFSVSQCDWSSNEGPHIIPITRPGTPNPTPEPAHRLSPGAIAGIAIGAAIAILTALILGLLLWRKHRRNPKQPKPNKQTQPVAELDSSGNDPYSIFLNYKKEGMPQSPELDSAVHQGHELDSSAQASPIYEAECPVYEMDANVRQSRTMTSPISFLSSRSDETKVHQRQQSDPVSFTTEGSDAAAKRQSGLTTPLTAEPTSPIRERSDAARKIQPKRPEPFSPEPIDMGKQHQRQQSDPVSTTTEGSEGGAKDQEKRLSGPTTLMRERSDAARKIQPKRPEPFSPPPETKDPVKQHSDPVSKTTDEPDSGAKDQEQRLSGSTTPKGEEPALPLRESSDAARKRPEPSSPETHDVAKQADDV